MSSGSRAMLQLCSLSGSWEAGRLGACTIHFCPKQMSHELHLKIHWLQGSSALTQGAEGPNTRTQPGPMPGGCPEWFKGQGASHLSLKELGPAETETFPEP